MGAAAVRQPPTYSIRVIKQAPDKLKLKGLLATEEDRKALLGLVKASFPSADVSDRLKVGNNPKADMKLGGISFALKALSFLQAGSANIDDYGVALSGGTESSAVYAELKSFMDAGLPTGVVLKEAQISAPPTSFFWRAELEAGRVKLAGAIPNQIGKTEMRAAVSKLFSGLEIFDQTYVVEGAPESWLDAAMHSLKVLRHLETGFVQLADRTIRLDGTASDEATLQKIDSLADKYPTGFSLESKVSAPEYSGIRFPQAAAAERNAQEKPQAEPMRPATIHSDTFGFISR